MLKTAKNEKGETIRERICPICLKRVKSPSLNKRGIHRRCLEKTAFFPVHSCLFASSPQQLSSLLDGC